MDAGRTREGSAGASTAVDMPIKMVFESREAQAASGCSEGVRRVRATGARVGGAVGGDRCVPGSEGQTFNTFDDKWPTAKGDAAHPKP